MNNAAFLSALRACGYMVRVDGFDWCCWFLSWGMADNDFDMSLTRYGETETGVVVHGGKVVRNPVTGMPVNAYPYSRTQVFSVKLAGTPQTKWRVEDGVFVIDGSELSRREMRVQ